MAFSRADSNALISMFERGDDASLARALRAGFIRDAVNVTSATITLTLADHAERLVTLNRAGGIAVTLPPSAGSGAVYRLYVGTTFTSDATIKVANASDTMVGFVTTATTTTGAGTHEAAGGTDDTITLNGTTSGGIVGSYLEFTSVAANVWLVDARLVGSGTLITPLSATVS